MMARAQLTPRDLARRDLPESPVDAGPDEDRTACIARDAEGQLLVRHREGDGEAFAALVAAYRAPVYSYLARCGVDPADRDDLFQDVFIKIHRSAATYQAHRPAHPWIFTIVSNTLRNHQRRGRVRHLIFAEPTADDPPDPAPDGERRTAARETAAKVERELARLRPVQREVVLLACVEKMALKEVGEVLKMPVNTVKTHLRRARLALAAALARRTAGTEVTP